MQGTGVNERGAVAGAQTALRDGLGLDEGAKFVVSGGRRTCLVAAEQLPLRYRFEAGFCFELSPVRQCWAFGEAAILKLRAGSLHTDSIGCIGFGVERHRFAVDDVVLAHPAFM